MCIMKKINEEYQKNTCQGFVTTLCVELFLITDKKLLGLMEAGRDAAHLYDAVMIYAWSVRKILNEGLGDPNNGTLVIELLKRRPYFRFEQIKTILSF